MKPTRLKKKRISVKPTTYVKGGKRIRRKGYVYTRKPSVRAGYVAERPDIGLIGRGEPKIQRAMGRPLAKGKMTAVINEMGYRSFKEMPSGAIHELAERLVDRFGARGAMGMCRAQVVFRKRLPDGVKRKFQALDEEIQRLGRY